MIVRGAIQYFAANGFDSETRALARSIGVSQGLIFHYFPTKEALIDRVYEEVFLGRWKPEWDQILGNRERSLRKRLKSFYKDYFETADRYEWIRITLYSALRDIDINTRYHRRVRERIIHVIALELREELGFCDPDSTITCYEEELVYALHANVIYQLIRKHIYHLSGPDNPGPVIEAFVDMFMDAVPRALHRLSSGEIIRGDPAVGRAP